ncbi:MAG: beta-glucosidase BglX [Alphaproteobacteria bacterium]|nr:beta-glucosidase BglX [Alphaproteobacteria bacterium]
MSQFIDDLIERMTLAEKIGQLNLVTPGGFTNTGPVVTEGVEQKICGGLVGGMFGIYGAAALRPLQQMAVEKTRLGIPLLFGLDVIHGHKTVFPLPLALACTWDMALIEKTARIAAVEAAADGLNWVFSPMVDIARDPRWGRIAEGSGEDPFLGAAIARAMVQGYQGDDLALPDTVMACVKHFALYGGAESGRDYNTVDMSRIRMYETYFPPYKAAVDAGVGSVMCAFNEVDGIPATGNKWLMTDVLRGEWGFEGLAVSDYTGINEMSAHGLGDLAAVAALSLRAGTDMDMVGEGYLTTLEKSLEDGRVSLGEIDQACRRVLEAKQKLGLFDDPFRYIDEKRTENILTADSRAFARETAAQSCVLLQNKAGVLPLKTAGTIAVIGPLAADRRNMQGTWSIAGDWQLCASVLDGIKAQCGQNTEILHARGANITNDPVLAQRLNFAGEKVDIDPRPPADMIAEALACAEKADVIVAVVGEAQEMSGEASCRADIGIPEDQRPLLEALAATGKPLVLVVITGRPLVLTWEQAHADAILLMWFGGTEAGHGTADVLFGQHNPSGRLAVTFPYHVGQVPVYYAHKNTGRPYGGDMLDKFKSRYLDIPNEPLWPFGFGLSYTTFDYGTLRLDKTALQGEDDRLQATIAVTNTGPVTGTETVQLYLTDPVASVARAVLDLRGFQKVHLAPGETADVTFSITSAALRFFNADLQHVWEPGEFIIHTGPHVAALKSAAVQWIRD